MKRAAGRPSHAALSLAWLVYIHTHQIVGVYPVCCVFHTLTRARFPLSSFSPTCVLFGDILKNTISSIMTFHVAAVNLCHSE